MSPHGDITKVARHADFRFGIQSGQNYTPVSPPQLIFFHPLILAVADRPRGCLCADHHVLFDLGVIGVNNDLTLIGSPGKLTVHPKHKINPAYLRYHQTLYSGGLRALFSK